MIGFSRVYDGDKLISIMCPLCFEHNAPVSARDGGNLSTQGHVTYDVCVACSAREYLYFANLMGA